MRIGVLFPGQGSQSIGMGKEWYAKSRYMQERFEDASVCLGTNVPRLCFGSSKELLNKTMYAQVSIYVVSSTLYHILERQGDVAPSLMAGHSVGQYAALCASGALNFTDGLHLVHKRAMHMQSAADRYAGAMVAVIGLPLAQVYALCAEYDEKGSVTKVAQVAAYNTDNQVVVACSQMHLTHLVTTIQKAGGRAIVLPVSGAFHSRLMRDAQRAFQLVFDEVKLRNAQVPVVSNISAKPLLTASELVSEMSEQICKPVNWQQSMDCFALCDVIIQVGPGKALINMVRRKWPEKTVLSFNTPRDLDAIARALG